MFEETLSRDCIPNFLLQISSNDRVASFRSKERSEVAGFFVFSHIRMIGYFSLG